MSSISIHVDTESETEGLARSLGALLRGGELIGLLGELGAGKTAFARALGYGAGVDEDIPITSPTFALLQHYQARFGYVHGDLFRLESPAELGELGILEGRDQGAVVVLEWAERFVQHFPEFDLWIEIARSGPTSRQIKASGLSPRGGQIIEELSRSCVA